MICTPSDSGGTPTRLEWYRGETKLTSSATAENGQKYEVTSVTPADAGSYKCKAVNADGSAESTLKTLTVKSEKQC